MPALGSGGGGFGSSGSFGGGSCGSGSLGGGSSDSGAAGFSASAGGGSAGSGSAGERGQGPGASTAAAIASAPLDHGATFLAAVSKAVSAQLGITKTFSAAYRPQANGLSEHSVGLTKRLLAKMMEETGEGDFTELVPFVQYALNTTARTSTGYSPHEVVFGRRGVLEARVSRT